MAEAGVLEEVDKKQNVTVSAGRGEEALPRPFGRLLLLKRLARGGMGEVYLAATRGIEGAERPVVVKRIREEHANDKSFRARFLDETRIMAQLRHPAVLQIMEAETTSDDVPYAVMEYVEGRHMGEVLTRATQLGVRVGWADAVAVGIGFADALAHIHTRTDAAGVPLEIAHRDLSPQNVMIGYAGDLKLIDFGTARGENRRCRTVSGVVYAKPGYVAPEVAQQIPGGPPADMYAFGVMLWEFAAGRRFLEGDPSLHQSRVAKGELRLPPLADRVGAPQELDTILQRLTETDPEKRLSNAARVAKDLVQVLSRAPSLADGDRSVRGRIAHLMSQLYPAEPARSRADFARRLADARTLLPSMEPRRRRTDSAEPGVPEASPDPGAVEERDGLLSGTRYRLVRIISRGTSNEVWEALHVDLGRTVALKLMPESQRPQGNARAQFRAEARALARLEHSGLVKIHDFGFTIDGRSYFGMELLEGETLEQRLERGPLAPSAAVPVISAVLDALRVAHKAGIVHRDITPSNLFLTRDGSVKLIDFGVAFVLGPKADGSSDDTDRVVGTPEYVSPEQAAGMPAELRSDLYSVGAVLYECLTGRVPHPLGPEGSPNLAALLTAKMTMAPPTLRQVRPDLEIAPALEKVVMTALHRDALKRFGSTDEFRAALDHAGRAPGPGRGRFGRAFLFSAAALPFLGIALLAVSGFLGSEKGEEAVSTESVRDNPVIDIDAIDLGDATSHPVPPGEPLASPETEQVAAGISEKQNDRFANEVDPQELDQVRRLLKSGRSIAAHDAMKRIAEGRLDQPEVLALLTQTARRVKAWGEALSVASLRVRIEPSADAYIELARLERATLKGDPLVSLRAALAIEPDNSRALELISAFEKQEKLAHR